MTKSRVESAVQELPPRGGRKSDISALRPLDRILRGPDKIPAVVVPETLNIPKDVLLETSPLGAAPSESSAIEIEEASSDDILFDEVVDEAELSAGTETPCPLEHSAHDAASRDRSAYEGPGYYETSREPFAEALIPQADSGEPGAPVHEGQAFRTFSEAAVQSLLDELGHSLSSALVDAERVLGEPERVALWFEMQARKRLLSLSARLSDELRATEVKKVLTSPPSKPLP